jgi:hypothetical protein
MQSELLAALRRYEEPTRRRPSHPDANTRPGPDTMAGAQQFCVEWEVAERS